MAVIDQVMYFAACDDCEWQSALKYEEWIAAGEERTHRVQEHPDGSL